MNVKQIRRIRTASQVVFFLLLVLLLVGTFCAVSVGPGFTLICPLGMLQLTIGSRELIWTAIIAGGILLTLTAALGRFFCGWICPFGAVLDWIGRFFRNCRQKNSQRFAALKSHDNRYVKYGILGGVLLAAGLVRYPVFCAVCPVGATCRAAGLQGVHAGLETMVAPAAIALESSRKRFWCRTLCPIGALLGLVARFSPLKIKLPWGSCLGCNRCEAACHMGNLPRLTGMNSLKRNPQIIKTLVEAGVPDALDRPDRFDRLPAGVRQALEEQGKRQGVESSECTRCFACQEACPLLNPDCGHPVLHSNQQLPG